MDFNPIFIPQQQMANLDSSQTSFTQGMKLNSASYLFSDIIKVFINSDTAIQNPIDAFNLQSINNTQNNGDVISNDSSLAIQDLMKSLEGILNNINSNEAIKEKSEDLFDNKKSAVNISAKGLDELIQSLISFVNENGLYIQNPDGGINTSENISVDNEELADIIKNTGEIKITSSKIDFNATIKIIPVNNEIFASNNSSVKPNSNIDLSSSEVLNKQNYLSTEIIAEDDLIPAEQKKIVTDQQVNQKIVKEFDGFISNENIEKDNKIKIVKTTTEAATEINKPSFSKQSVEIKPVENEKVLSKGAEKISADEAEPLKNSIPKNVQEETTKNELFSSDNSDKIIKGSKKSNNDFNLNNIKAESGITKEIQKENIVQKDDQISSEKVLKQNINSDENISKNVTDSTKEFKNIKIKTSSTENHKENSHKPEKTSLINENKLPADTIKNLNSVSIKQEEKPIKEDLFLGLKKLESDIQIEKIKLISNDKPETYKVTIEVNQKEIAKPVKEESIVIKEEQNTFIKKDETVKADIKDSNSNTFKQHETEKNQSEKSIAEKSPIDLKTEIKNDKADLKVSEQVDANKNSVNEKAANNIEPKERSGFTKNVTNEPHLSFKDRIETYTNLKENIKTIKTANLINEISSLFNQGEKKVVTLKLMPENFGKVNITIDIVDKSLNAKVEVENESIKQVIQSNVDYLRQSLNNNGLILNNFNISLASNEQKPYKPLEQQKKKSHGSKSEEKNINNISNPVAKHLGYNTYEFLA